MITIYGILDNNNTHTDVSNSLLGAKQYATRNGFNKVSKRNGYNAFLIAEKINNNWVKS